MPEDRAGGDEWVAAEQCAGGRYEILQRPRKAEGGTCGLREEEPAKLGWVLWRSHGYDGRRRREKGDGEI